MAPNRSSVYSLTPSRRSTSRNTLALEAQAGASAREFRRVIGYHNALVEDFGNGNENEAEPEPPTYEITIFRPARNRPRASRRLEEGTEPLPGYSCTVAIEGPLSMKLEQINPFEVAERPMWNDVYITLTGPLLQVHALKKPQGVLGNKNIKPSQLCGRLLKAYTLQHGEVGIAADHAKVELVPKSSFVHMLPEGAIERLQESEPQLFEPVRRHVVRLRLETDQFLLRFDSSEDRARWLEKLCAAVDIAPALDDRTEPKYHTLPRRRRRNNAVMRAALAQALAASLADQEGGGATSQSQTNDQLPIRPGEEPDNAVMNTTTLDPDMADIDTGFAITDMPEIIPEDRSSGLTTLFRIFSSSIAPNSSAFGSPLSATNSNSAQAPASAPAPQASASTRIPARIYPDDYHKWQPQFLIDPAQQIRYRRHCLPNLLYASKRANDVVVKDGMRWKIDWEKDVLKPFPEIPPTYDDIVVDQSNEDMDGAMFDRRSTARVSMEEDDTAPRPRLLQRLSGLRRRSIDSNRSSIYDQFVSAGPSTPVASQRRSMEMNRAPLSNQRRSVDLNRNTATANNRRSVEVRRTPTWEPTSPGGMSSAARMSMDASRILGPETSSATDTAVPSLAATPMVPGPLSSNPVMNPLSSNPTTMRSWNAPPRARPNSMFTMPSARPVSIATRPMSMDIARIEEVDEHDRAPSRLAQTSISKASAAVPAKAPIPEVTSKKSSLSGKFASLRRLFHRKPKETPMPESEAAVAQTPAAPPRSSFMSRVTSRNRTARPSMDVSGATGRPSMEATTATVRPSGDFSGPNVRPSMDMPRRRGRPSFDMFRRRSRVSMDTARPSVRPSMDTARPSVRPSMDTARPSVRPSMDMPRPSFQRMESLESVTPMATARVSTDFPQSAFPWRSSNVATPVVSSRVSTEISRPYFQGSSNMVTTPTASSRVSTEMSRPSFQRVDSSGTTTTLTMSARISTEMSHSQASSRMPSSPLANAPIGVDENVDAWRTGSTVTAGGSPRKIRGSGDGGRESFWRKRLSRKFHGLTGHGPMAVHSEAVKPDLRGFDGRDGDAVAGDADVESRGDDVFSPASPPTSMQPESAISLSQSPQKQAQMQMQSNRISTLTEVREEEQEHDIESPPPPVNSQAVTEHNTNGQQQHHQHDGNSNSNSNSNNTSTTTSPVSHRGNNLDNDEAASRSGSSSSTENCEGETTDGDNDGDIHGVLNGGTGTGLGQTQQESMLFVKRICVGGGGDVVGEEVVVGRGGVM